MTETTLKRNKHFKALNKYYTRKSSAIKEFNKIVEAKISPRVFIESINYNKMFVICVFNPYYDEKEDFNK